MINLIAGILLYGCVSAAILSTTFFISRELIIRWKLSRLRLRAERLQDLLTSLREGNVRAFDSVIRRFGTLKDLSALELILEERRQQLGPDSQPQEVLRLYESYDKLGIVEKYIHVLEHGRRWTDRAFAAEFLGEIGNVKAVEPLIRVMRNTRIEDRDVRLAAGRALGKIRDPRALEPLIEALGLPESWLPARIAEIILRFGREAFEPLVARLKTSDQTTLRVWAAEILGELGDPQAFAPLLASLTDLNDQVRARAASALGKLKDRRAVNELISMMLGDPVPFVRIHVVRALGEIGDPRALHHLIDSLNDGEWWVRIRVVEALEQLGEIALEPLSLALDDDDAEVRKRAALTLERLGVVEQMVSKLDKDDLAAREKLIVMGQAGVVESLIAALEGASQRVRLELAKLMGEIKNDAVSEALIECMEQEQDPAIRAAAISSLAQLKESRAAEGITRLLGYPNEIVRVAAVAALDRIPVPDPNNLLAPMVSDPDPRVRRGAARVLGRVGNSDSSPILQGLLRDCDAGVRVEAATSLGLLKAEDAVDVLIEAFRDYDPKVQLAAARSLGQVGSPRSLKTLVDGFENASDELMKAIAWSIGKIEWPDPDALIDELFRGSDRRSRLGVIAALGRVDSGAGNALIRSMLEDRDEEVVRRAVETIGDHRDEEALGSLHSLVMSPSETVRGSVLDALGKIRSPASLSVLIAALDDPSDKVRARAILALGLYRDPSTREILWSMLEHGGRNSPLAPFLLLSLMSVQRDGGLIRFLDALEEIDLTDFLSRGENRRDAVLRALVDSLRSIDSIEYMVATTWDREDLEETLIREVRTSRDSIRRVKSIKILAHLESEAAFPAIWRAFFKDPEDSVRLAAMRYLREMAPPDDFYRALLEGIADPSGRIQVAALEELHSLPWERCLPVILKNVESKNSEIQRILVDHFAGLPSKERASLLDSLMGSFSGIGAKSLAARVVARSRGIFGEEMLHCFFEDEDVRVRRVVVEGIRHLPRKQIPRFIELARSDPDDGVREAAVDAATSMGTKASLPLLESFLDDPDPRIRRRAVLALGRFGKGAALDSLRPLLLDSSVLVRSATVASLMVLGEDGIEDRLSLESLGEVSRTVAELVDPEEIRRTLRSSRSVRKRSIALRIAFVLDDRTRAKALADANLDPSEKIRSLRNKLSHLMDRWLLDPKAEELLGVTAPPGDPARVTKVS